MAVRPQIANLEAERASLEMRYQEAIREVEEGAAQRIAAIEREKAEMEAAYQQRVAALEAELAGAGEMLAAAEARLESEVAEAKERYESQATSLRAELSAAMERAKSADARKDEEVARVLELRAQMESLRSGMERDRINAERAYEQETARLREALSLAEGRMVELSPADGADYVARVAELERELEVARAEAKAERELLVNEMESQVYEVRLELDAARSALADAEIRAHEQADVEVERLRRMLLEAQELAAGAVRESEQKYGREVVSVRQALLEAERELETLMEARSDWEEREEALVAEVSALRARTGELEAEKRAERERGRREMACELKERGGEMTADEWEEVSSACGLHLCLELRMVQCDALLSDTQH